MRTKVLFAMAMLGWLLVGCVAPPKVEPVKSAPVFQLRTPIEFNNFQFEVIRAVFAPSFRNWIGQETRSADQFLIIDVAVTNKTGSPLPTHFQPSYRLADYSGALYDSHLGYTIGINMGKAGRMQAGQTMNPNVKYNYQIVFEVPKNNLFLVVITPERARIGFGGATTASGPYFMVDLPKEQL